jgi:hypothetical protein
MPRNTLEVVLEVTLEVILDHVLVIKTMTSLILDYVVTAYLYIRSAKQDDNYGASNIVLPCPSS